MARKPHNCGECLHLKRTSPEQVFLLCTFWSADNVPMEAIRAAGFTQNDIVLHCHMQSEAPACPLFRARQTLARAS